MGWIEMPQRSSLLPYRGVLSFLSKHGKHKAVKRRDFITMLGGAAAGWPLAARAQQPDRMRRIGVLSNIAEDDPQMKARFGAFRQALEKLGWSEGRNVRIDTRFGPADAEQMEARAKELLALQPDLILANSTEGNN